MAEYCELCGCHLSSNLPNSLALAQHNQGRRHLRNVAAIGIPNPATPDPPPVAPDPRVTVSHEDGLDFVVEGIEVAGQLSFFPVEQTIVIEKTQVASSLSVPSLRLVRTTNTPASCFNVSWPGETSVVRQNQPSEVLVSFQAPHAGTFRMSLQIVFNDNSRRNGRKFIILRELRGRATISGRHVGAVHPRESFPKSSLVDDQAALSTEEEDAILDNRGGGISVSDEGGVDFGIIGRNDLDGPFGTPSYSITINNARGSPTVTFVEAGIRSQERSHTGFRATFNGHSQAFLPGTERTVQIDFIPEFEGRFEAVLRLIFESQELGQFAVFRSLRAIAGSVEDHERFESLNQGASGFIPRSGNGQQVPLERIVRLRWASGYFWDRPEYELPPLVQRAVYVAPSTHAYNKMAPGLIARLKPRELTMETYAKYFTALLNVNEGHWRRDILDQHPFEVDVQEEGSSYFVEFENRDEDLLPEVIEGDFLWLEDKQEDAKYEARIQTAHVLRRSSLAVLQIFLKVPTSFNLYHGVQFLLHLGLNRITLCRQYHALASHLTPLRRLLFPSASDIKPIQRLSEGEVAGLQLVNENIREDEQQLQTVVSILQQPKGTVPFIIFGPPGTGKTSTVVESIMQLLRRDASFKILVCTPSNAASDLLVVRLAAAGLTVDQLLRWNALSRDMRSISEPVRAFSKIPRGVDLPPFHVDLRPFRVVVSTCSSAGYFQYHYISAGHFSHIVIDEAAQAEEPLALIPFEAFCNEHTNVILAGDPHQLGPVIKSTPASEAGLGKSYLERLMLISEVYGLDTQAGKTIVDLQRNRRSHGAIIAWPNRYLYEDKMRADASQDVSHLLLQSDVLPKKGFPIVFHGIKGRELRTRHSTSYLNFHEASVVRIYCQKLTEDRERKICAKDIGVIAPYKAQVRAIRELLKPAGLSDVSVGSVEQFQGQERKVIIFATTRSNLEADKRKAMGFLENRRRMNVAITRAQALLIVVGDPEVLGKDELWRTFLNYVCRCRGSTGKKLGWDPAAEVSVPGYEVIPRAGGVVLGESYMDGRSENIYRFSSQLRGVDEEGWAISW